MHFGPKSKDGSHFSETRSADLELDGFDRSHFSQRGPCSPFIRHKLQQYPCSWVLCFLNLQPARRHFSGSAGPRTCAAGSTGFGPSEVRALDPQPITHSTGQTCCKHVSLSHMLGINAVCHVVFCIANHHRLMYPDDQNIYTSGTPQKCCYRYSQYQKGLNMSKSNNFSEGTRTHMVRRDIFFRQKIKLPEYLIFPVCRYLSCDLSGTIPHPKLPTNSLPQKIISLGGFFLSSGLSSRSAPQHCCLLRL